MYVCIRTRTCSCTPIFLSTSKTKCKAHYYQELCHLVILSNSLYKENLGLNPTSELLKPFSSLLFLIFVIIKFYEKGEF